MSTSDFDRIFKEKFDEHEFAYNPKNWDLLSHDLPKENKKRKLLPWLTGIAASVALLAGGYWFFHNAPDKKNDVVVNEQVQHKSLKRVEKSTYENSDLQNSKTTEETEPNQTVPQQQILMPDNTIANNKPLNEPNLKKSVAVSPPPQQTVNSPIEPYEKNLLYFDVNPATTKPREDVVTTRKSETNTYPTVSDDPKNPIFFSDDETPKTPSRKPVISLAGGFNYGSLNTAYGAAVNAHQKIGNRFFIEGDLGVMRNQEVYAASMSTNQFNTITSNTGLGRPAKVEEKPNNIYYVQLSPSVGYQLHKNISIGVGADMQKLLDGNNGSRPVIATEEGFKLVPLWDAGITGKTEYTISKRLKAAMLYREGVNNLLQGDNRYFERRYLQVQMKWRLFGK